MYAVGTYVCPISMLRSAIRVPRADLLSSTLNFRTMHAQHILGTYIHVYFNNNRVLPHETAVACQFM